jgi:predicted site-specific integrase-resolvase
MPVTTAVESTFPSREDSFCYFRLLELSCRRLQQLKDTYPMELVELGRVRRLVIAHKDRLVRFGYGYFEAFCQRHNTEIIVMNGETMSPEQELVQDLLAIVTVFSSRLHGLRSYKKVLKDAALQKDQT